MVPGSPALRAYGRDDNRDRSYCTNCVAENSAAFVSDACVAPGAVTPHASIHAGQCFGETDLIAGETSRATAIADKAGKLLKIARRDILEILRRDQALASKLLWNLASELGKRLEDAQIQLSKGHGEDKTMIVDIDEAMDPPENVEDTNPRGVVVIPKLTTSRHKTTGEPEIVEEIDDFEDVLDEGG